MPERHASPAVWIAIGIAMGAGIGAVTHNIAIWTAVGVIFGIAIARIARG